MRFFSLACLLLTGCSTFTKPEPNSPVIPVTNEKKDQYIQKIEQVVSDSASALTAVSPTLPQGVSRTLIDNQTERLSGIAKPSIERVREYERIIKENDSKAAKKDSDSAKKSETEIAEHKKRADEAESALVIQQLITEQAEAERVNALKDKTLWQYSMAGLGLFVSGILALAFTPFKKNAVVMVLGGVIGMSVAWVFEAEWFPWVVGGTATLVALSGLALVVSFVIRKIKGEGKEGAVNQEGQPEQKQED